MTDIIFSNEKFLKKKNKIQFQNFKLFFEKIIPKKLLCILTECFFWEGKDPAKDEGRNTHLLKLMNKVHKLARSGDTQDHERRYS